MGSSKKQTIGHRYFAGMHMVLCHGPIDRIKRVYVDSTEVWSGNGIDGSFQIDAEGAFGGEKREGGISGTFDIMLGKATQGVNSYLQGVLSGLVPAYRGVVSVVLNQCYLGMNPYLKPWSFEAENIYAGFSVWEQGLADIDVTVTRGDGTTDVVKAMNAVHIIRECIVNTIWGMGYSDTRIDDVQFAIVAAKLKTEGMGLCLYWDTEMPIEDFIALVIRHVDVVLYVDRKTGKFTMREIRKVTAVDLPQVNPSNIIKIIDPVFPVFGELTTHVTVEYHNLAKNEKASVTVSDQGLAEEQRSEKHTTVTYEGFVNADTATRAADRDLQVLSNPSFSCTIEAIADDPEIKNIVQGGVFILNYPDYKRVNERMRVTKLSYSDHRSNRVQIECVQDRFALPDTPVVQVPPSAWVNPTEQPGAITLRFAEEATYYQLVQNSGESAVNDAIEDNPNLGYVTAAAGAPTGFAINAQLWANSGSGFEEEEQVEFMPTAVLDGAIGYIDTNIEIKSGVSLSDVEINSLLSIDDEIMSVVAISGSTLTVKRGVLDTVPALHANDSSVLFWDEDAEIVETEFVTGDVVNVKLLAQNGGFVYDLNLDIADVVNLNARAVRPFPMGNVQVDNQYYPTDDTSSDIVITWVDRNRLLATGGSFVGFLDGNVTIEPGTTYHIEIIDSDGLTFFTDDDISSPYTIPALTYDGKDGWLDLKLFSRRGGFDSYQAYTIRRLLVTAVGADGVDFAMDVTAPAAPPSDQVNFSMDETA